jgi:hypothetical protein
VIEADLVADAVRTIMTTKPEWTGTATALLRVLAEGAEDRTTKSTSWPATPAALRGRLRRVAPGLRRIGVEIAFPGKNARPRNIRITSTILARSEPENKGVRLSELSEPSEATATSNPDKDLAAPERATVFRRFEQTVGDTVAANPLKSKVSDSSDSSDSKTAGQSGLLGPAWRTRL